MALLNALDTQYRNSILDQVYDWLPDRPYCGTMKGAQFIAGKNKAVNFPYLQLNSPWETRFLIFDIDLSRHPKGTDLQFLWKEKGLPAPNLVVSTVTGNIGEPDILQGCHYVYALKSSVFETPGHKRPRQWMEAIKRGYIVELNADPAFVGLMTKNPFHRDWHVMELASEPYELAELAKWVDTTAKVAANRNYNVRREEGRNTELYDELRFWAYPRVAEARETITREQWFNDVWTRALELYDQINYDDPHKKPYTLSECKATAKSVAKWTWHRYTGSHIQRGIMGLANSNLSLKEKQRKAALWVAERKAAKTLAMIQQAYDDLAMRGRCCKIDLANKTGLSLSTVKRHFSEISRDFFEVMSRFKDRVRVTPQKRVIRCQSDKSALGRSQVALDDDPIVNAFQLNLFGKPTEPPGKEA
jgi:hypothetical protein